jgi:hypothetical protein
MTDVTRLDKITSLRKAESRAPAYSDFFVNFNKHPETGALIRAINEDSVKKSLRNLLMTNKGERLYKPNFGCDIKRILFEPMTAVTADTLQTFIDDAIRSNEPRVRPIQIEVVPDEIANGYRVAIIYEVINSTQPQTLTLTLYRVR